MAIRLLSAFRRRLVAFADYPGWVVPVIPQVVRPVVAGMKGSYSAARSGLVVAGSSSSSSSAGDTGRRLSLGVDGGGRGGLAVGDGGWQIFPGVWLPQFEERSAGWDVRFSEWGRRSEARAVRCRWPGADERARRVGFCRGFVGAGVRPVVPDRVAEREPGSGGEAPGRRFDTTFKIV